MAASGLGEMGFWARFFTVAVCIGVYAAAASHGVLWELAPPPESDLLTPADVLPPRLALPLFAMLRAVTADVVNPLTSEILISAKFGGVLTALLALLAPLRLAAINWAKTSDARWALFTALALALVAWLAWLGAQPADGSALRQAQIATLLYFVLMIAAPRILRSTR